jgi:hypothetical protein
VPASELEQRFLPIMLNASRELSSQLFKPMWVGRRGVLPAEALSECVRLSRAGHPTSVRIH